MHTQRFNRILFGAALALAPACNQLEKLDGEGGGGGIPTEVRAAFETSCAKVGCHISGGVPPTLAGGDLDGIVGTKYVTIGDLAASEIALRILPDATLAELGVTRPGARMPLGGPYDTPELQTIIAWIAGAEFPEPDTGGTTGDPTTGGASSSTGMPEPLEPTFTNVKEAVITPYCSCHNAAPLDGLNGGLDLRLETAYATIVDKPSIDLPAIKQIAPGDPDMSYFYMKITGAPGIMGLPMPQAQMVTLPEDLQMLVADWITAGALDD